MASETIDISLRADISHLKAELAKIEGLGKQEATAMVGAMVREYRRAERATKKLADTTAKEMKRAAREAEKAAEQAAREIKRVADETARRNKAVMDGASSAAERTASLMGGAFGDVSDSIIDLGSRMADLSSSIGGVKGAAVGMVGGLAAVSAGIVFAARATLEWMDGAEELQQRLDAVSGLPPLHPEHVAALDAYKEASSDADAASARLSLTLMGQMAPAMTEVQHATMGAASATSYFIAGLGDFRENTPYLSAFLDGFDDIRESLVLLNPTGSAVEWMFGAMADRGRELSQVVQEVKEDSDSLADTWEDFGPSMDAFAEGEREAAKAAREWAAAQREAERAAKDLDRAIERFDRNLAGVSKAWEGVEEDADEALTAIEAKVAAYLQSLDDDWDDSLSAITEGWSDIEAEADAAGAAIAASGAEWARQYRAAWAEAAVGLTESLIGVAAFQSEQTIASIEEQREAREKEHSAAMAVIDSDREAIEVAQEAGEISAEQAEADLEAIAAREAAEKQKNREIKKQEEKNMLSAFKAKQSAARAAAVMSAAEAYMGLLSSLAYLGPAAPVAAAGIVGPALAVNLASIDAEAPPEFPDGGMVGSRLTPDHVMIGARPDEAVLSPRGVRNAGGPDGVAALNAGGGGGGGGQPILQLDGQTMGAVMVRTMRTSRGVGRELDRRAGTRPGIRGRGR